MLEDLIEMHQEVMKTTPKTVKRYCYSQINWKSNGICILGDRG